MNGVDILLKEHENINVFADLVENMCCGILEGKKINLADVRLCADFGHTYADVHHHRKEEEVLFKAMTENLGQVAENLIKYGMNVEHDMARATIMNIQNATDIYEKEATTKNKLAVISYLMAYANMLRLHIVKENTAVYPFGQKSLSADVLALVDRDTEQFEKEFAADSEKGLAMLNQLREKYLA